MIQNVPEELHRSTDLSGVINCTVRNIYFDQYNPQIIHIIHRLKPTCAKYGNPDILDWAIQYLLSKLETKCKEGKINILRRSGRM